MADYAKLVSSIANNKILAHTIREEYSDCLNLISTDWEVRLKNNMTYQDLQTPSLDNWTAPHVSDTYTYETLKIEPLTFLLAGQCRFAKRFKNILYRPAVIVNESVPLMTVAKTMFSDKGSQVPISSDFKFHFEPCSTLVCTTCSTQFKRFTEKGYAIARYRQPCICDTKIFDGQEVVNRFFSQLTRAFPHEFLAVLKVKLTSRYSYTDTRHAVCHRVGGTLVDLIAFPPSRLSPSKPLNVGALPRANDPSKKRKRTHETADAEFDPLFEGEKQLEGQEKVCQGEVQEEGDEETFILYHDEDEKTFLLDDE